MKISEVGEMLSQLQWIEEEGAGDYCEILEAPRESGDGESKETSPHTSASEDDNQESQQVAEGKKNEKRKEKKMSRIPVRQIKTSHAVESKSAYEHGQTECPKTVLFDDFKRLVKAESESDSACPKLVENAISTCAEEQNPADPSTATDAAVINDSSLLGPRVNEDLILEAPEEFRSHLDAINSSQSVDSGKVGVAFECDTDRLSDGEKLGQREITRTNEGASGGESGEKTDANEQKAQLAAPTSSTMEIMRDIEDNNHQHAREDVGVLEDNDQILSNSAGVLNADAETRSESEVVGGGGEEVEEDAEGLDGSDDEGLVIVRVADDCASDLDERNVGGIHTLDTRWSEGRGPFSGLEEGAYACPEHEEPSLTTVVVVAAAAAAVADPSIEIGVAASAQAPRCSRTSTATDCASSTENFPSPVTSHHHGDDPSDHHRQLSKDADDHDPDPHLIWDFQNGRLVFQTTDYSKSSPVSPLLEAVRICTEKIERITALESDSDEIKDVLCSRDLNKRVVEGRSRLKHLESKLKKAGITDELTITSRADKGNEELEVSFDRNQNVVKGDRKSLDNLGATVGEEEKPELEDDTGGGWCEFDVRQVDSFAGYGDSDFFVVYDELEDSANEDEECEERDHYHLIREEMRGDGTMGTDGERSTNKHNPDRENLKSLLKKPGRRDHRDHRDPKRNRVVFNETKNEFFDADYIILIREECDYDDEDDDGVCTCNEHEMVRLTCCEPNCNCNLYDGYAGDQTPQSPKFAPPLEFVDAVTLSPPEGYKDMELGEQQLFALQQMARRNQQQQQQQQQQRTAVCRDCSASHDDAGEESPPEAEEQRNQSPDQEKGKEAEKTDQSQQTTPTTPPADADSQNQQLGEGVTIRSGRERRNAREAEEKSVMNAPFPPGSSAISGILKGGRLWKQHSQDNAKMIEMQQATDSSATSDEESNNGNKRSVRFIESNDTARVRDNCDGADDKHIDEDTKPDSNNDLKSESICNESVSPEATEMTLTFKLGNHILISNNSLKPNSAMRQLFPSSKPLGSKPGEADSLHQYLVTSESLRAFEEAKRSKLPQIIQSEETDDSIKKAIERNTLRRSLIRYEPRSKKKEPKTDNSLVERIKQLTCDVDDDASQDSQDIPPRSSPPGEEARKSPELNPVNKNIDKSFSPSSSSTASSNSSSVSSTYRKITDLFAKKEKPPDIQNTSEIIVKPLNHLGPAPDLGNTGSHPLDVASIHSPITKANSNTEARKQFLSTLAPLTACMTNPGTDEQYYHLANNAGDRNSLSSSLGTEYSLEDIDEGLKVEEDDTKKNAPDVVVGTPSASESGDELAMFVQQDAGRIERIKKKYQQDNNEEDDEHDDYGFNKRPSVRGIKPRFGTTTEILQQIQNQMQPPPATPKVNAHISWPYYSEASLSGMDNNKSRTINHNVPQYQGYIQYRPSSLTEENMYQNCANQRCSREIVYKTNANHVHSPVMRVGGGSCSEFYHQTPNRTRNGRPESPPPLDVAKNYHQTMVYIPYNHIENYQTGCVSPNPQYIANDKCYARVINQNQINTRYEPMYHNQPRMAHPIAVDDPHYQTMLKHANKPLIRPAYASPAPAAPHLLPASRSESPLPGQFSTARSTQTSAPTIATCNYYPPPHIRYRPTIGPITHTTVLWNSETMYGNKGNRHSFPAIGPRYPVPDNISLTDSESQYNAGMPNGYRQTIETTFSAQRDSVPNSPTKTRFIERGVPEGAASVSPQDSTSAQSTSTMTSPTSPQNPQPTNPKPLFYAMNV